MSNLNDCHGIIQSIFFIKQKVYMFRNVFFYAQYMLDLISKLTVKGLCLKIRKIQETINESFTCILILIVFV